MATFAQFKATLSICSTQELRDYIDAVNEELFRRVRPVSTSDDDKAPEGADSAQLAQGLAANMGGMAPVDEHSVEALMGMGFSRETVIQALRAAGGDVNAATAMEINADRNVMASSQSVVSPPVSSKPSRTGRGSQDSEGNPDGAQSTASTRKSKSLLPTWFRCCPRAPAAEEFFSTYQPVELEKKVLKEQIRMFLKLIKCSSFSAKNGYQSKAYYCRYFFRLLAVNMWFMDENKKFQAVVTKQLLDFQTDSKTKELAAEFAFLMGNITCSYCGKVGAWSNFDGNDYFCSEEHTDTFMLNGDCAQDLSITSEQLDAELDEYHRKTDCKTNGLQPAPEDPLRSNFQVIDEYTKASK